MKPHRRGITRITWFKLTVCACLAAMAASLFTPYPAQIIRALKGEPEPATDVPDAYPPHTSLPPEQPDQTQTAAPDTAGRPGTATEDVRLLSPWTPERTIALPPVQYPPFPPVLPTRPSTGALTNIYELARGLNLKTQANFLPGTLASSDKKTKSNYQMTLTLNVKQPQALTKKEDILKLNPKLEAILPDLSTLFSHARVSPYYGQIYARKQTEIRKNLASLTKLLDRHNFYDTETILEITHPETRRKLLWLQSEMDVVSDGSDGDRLSTMPDKILKSSFYQPSTSYRWKKRTDKPNPLLKPWQQRLAAYKASLAKAPTAEKAALRSKIDHAERVIAELKRYSFLISEYDPFIVVPLGVVNQSSPFSPQFGDYAVVIVDGKLYPALVGAAGPRYKPGDGSLRLRREINPNSGPYHRPESDLEVSYLIFPGTAEPEAGPPDYEKFTAKCRELLNDIGGMGDAFKLHQWEDLLAPKPPPVPAPSPSPSASGKEPETTAKDGKTAADKPSESPSSPSSPTPSATSSPAAP